MVVSCTKAGTRHGGLRTQEARQSGNEPDCGRTRIVVPTSGTAEAGQKASGENDGPQSGFLSDWWWVPPDPRRTAAWRGVAEVGGRAQRRQQTARQVRPSSSDHQRHSSCCRHPSVGGGARGRLQAAAYRTTTTTTQHPTIMSSLRRLVRVAQQPADEEEPTIMRGLTINNARGRRGAGRRRGEDGGDDGSRTARCR